MLLNFGTSLVLVILTHSSDHEANVFLLFAFILLYFFFSSSIDKPSDSLSIGNCDNSQQVRLEELMLFNCMRIFFWGSFIATIMQIYKFSISQTVQVNTKLDLYNTVFEIVSLSKSIEE